MARCTYFEYDGEVFTNNNGEIESLELQGSARVGGFAWHEGYQEGTAYCNMTLLKVGEEFPLRSSDSFASPDVELDNE